MLETKEEGIKKADSGEGKEETKNDGKQSKNKKVRGKDDVKSLEPPNLFLDHHKLKVKSTNKSTERSDG